MLQLIICKITYLTLIVNILLTTKTEASNISHCHHCNSNEDMRCSSDLGNEKFWQICPEVFPYCVFILQDGIVSRGCSDGDFCRHNPHDLCCVCLGEGCNWPAHCTAIRNFATTSIIVGLGSIVIAIWQQFHYLSH